MATSRIAGTRRANTPAPTVKRTTPPRTPAPRTTVSIPTQARRQIEYVDINDLAPYPFNPRDNSAAIASVAESIKAFGFWVPCVIDENNVLVAGHTRVEAAKLLGMTEIPCLRMVDLTPEQVNAFRVIDNKVAEQAKWDFDLLAGEIAKLDGLGLDFTAFGWTQENLDCMSQLVSSDCLSVADLTPEAEIGQAAGQQARRSPQQARFVLGEIVFFIPIAQYRNWVDGLRQLHNFSEDNIADDLKTRLGILN